MRNGRRLPHVSVPGAAGVRGQKCARPPSVDGPRRLHGRAKGGEPVSLVHSPGSMPGGGACLRSSAAPAAACRRCSCARLLRRRKRASLATHPSPHSPPPPALAAPLTVCSRFCGQGLQESVRPAESRGAAEGRADAVPDLPSGEGAEGKHRPDRQVPSRLAEVSGTAGGVGGDAQAG